MLPEAPLSHRMRGPSNEVDAEYGHSPHTGDAVQLLPGLQGQDGSAKSSSSSSSSSPTKMLAKTKNGKKNKPNTKPTTDRGAKPGGASKILFLDGLRGLAAMLVIVQHCGYMGVSMGQPAVDTFFVLSAFLLTMIFEKKARTLLEQNASYKRWGFALADYFARRFLRVYPLFMIVAIYLTVYSSEQKEKLFRVHHPKNYSIFKVLTFEFKFRYHVFWTLPLEISYYFIIPIFVVILLKLKKYWIVPMFPLGYLVLYSGFYWYRLDHMPLKPHLPTFLCGSMAAFIYAKIDQWISSRSFVFRWYHKLMLRTIEMSSLALLLSTVFGGLFFDWIIKNPIPQTAGGHFVSATVSVIIICEMLQRGTISSVLEWSLLRYAGKVSFSMYMLHSFVIYSDFIQNQHSFYNKLFAIWGLCFLLSGASYQLIEYPSQWLAGKVGKMIKKRDDAERLMERQALPTTATSAD